MNDSVEATFGWGRIERFLDSKSPSSAKEKEVIRLAKAGLHGASNKTDFPDSYIACFSEKGNDLSQWRAYGRGRGFSIGFDSDELNRLARAIGGSDLFPPSEKLHTATRSKNILLKLITDNESRLNSLTSRR
jgi:hypothetical protein